MGDQSDDQKTDRVPDDVYIQFVRSLFENAHILLIGGVCNWIVAFAIFHRTGITAYLVFAFVLLAINIWRYDGIRSFHRAGGVLKDVADANKWERDYIIRGCAQGLGVGSFAFASIYIYRDTYAELASVCLTMACLVTVVSRNYGSSKMVKILSTTFIGLPCAAFLLSLEFYQMILGFMIFPLLSVSIQSARHLRYVLLSAVLGRQKSAQLAQRFDRALNTMPQGLLMFNSEGRVIVANSEAAALLGMRSTEALVGRSLRALMLRLVVSVKIDRERGTYALAQLSGAIRQGFDRKLMIELADGRVFELSTREGDQNIGVVLFEDVTTRVTAEKRVATMARFDSLTGLPNRAHLREMVFEKLGKGDPKRTCALAIFDLDDFKGVNDTLGHPIGDGLIFAVAERLGAFVNDNVVVSRFGGDEFMVYIDNVDRQNDLASMLQPMFASLQGDVEVAGHALRIQASGGAVCCVAAEADLDAMTVKADLALYNAKEQGKNGWRLFEGQMEQAFRNRQTLKADLRTAVETGGLRVVYQPIVSLQTMRMVSCEALCRWDHPDLGAISPALFIPLAEEMGIVSEITTYVLNAACAECVNWPETICVSVNLSAKDFSDTEIVNKVQSILNSTGLAPHRLEIEVTETALLDDKSQTERCLTELRALGVRIALDDFGTGYSSLSYLHRLPLDKIKIDRSFLADVEQNERSLDLLSGVVNLSRQLGLMVTIEGVETFHQLNILTTEVRADLAQGFLFGSALTASGISTMATTAWPFSRGQRAIRPAAVG